ncbi:MAG TPA: DUF6256 family protein [Actinomycetota bacterium]|nr:DUF6256 family protein [Actinomycetota bacterium]
MGFRFNPGWAPPLLAQGVAGAEAHGWWDVVRHDVIPVAAAYLLFLGLLITYHRATRRRVAGPGNHEEGQRGDVPTDLAPGWGHLVRYLAGTVFGGYLVFLSIVVVFYFVLGGEDREFIRQALVEGSFLAFALVVPAFLLFSAIAELWSDRGGPHTLRGRRSGAP